MPAQPALADNGRMGHSHSKSASRHHLPSRERRIFLTAIALTVVFAAVEAIGGWLSGSLALLSDAGHMVTDGAALAIALFAQLMAQRPPSQRASYGYARAEVIGVFINALVMLGIVAWIATEAVRRLLSPTPVAGGLVVVVAAAGLLVNLGTAWLLMKSSSMGARGALLHVMSDMLGSVAAIVSGGVISATGWTPIDPILSLFVAVLILRSTWMLLKSSTHVLMEGVPEHLSYDDIGRALTRLPGVTAVHDLHVWYVASDRAALSAHVLIREASAWPQTLVAAQRLLADRFGIEHVTLQPAWHAPLEGKRVIPVTPVGDDKPHVH